LGTRDIKKNSTKQAVPAPIFGTVIVGYPQQWDKKHVRLMQQAQTGVAGVIGGFFTVVEVAKIITLWPWHERRSNSWKINGRVRAHCMGFLATLITAATERSWLP